MTQNGTAISFKALGGFLVVAAVAAAPAPSISDGGLSVGNAAYAQASEEEGGRAQRKTKRVQAASKPVYDKLTEAQELMEAEDLPGALEVMEDLRDDKLSSYERVLMEQMFGYIYASLEDYPKALGSFERMLQEEDIPDGVRNQTLYSMAQLYMITEEYKKGIDTLKRWFSVVESPGADAYYLLAVAYIQNDDFQAAVEPAETMMRLAKESYARRMAEAAEDPEVEEPDMIRESWYTTLLAIYFETKQFEKARDIISELLDIYPKRDYWLQLSGISSELGREWDQLGAMEAAYRQGLLVNENEFENLAQLYMYNGVPIKGAWVVEKAFAEGKLEKTEDSWELLANAYFNAQEMEKSVEPLTRAAELSEDGDLYVRLGQSYLEMARWDKAAESFALALDKGDIRNPGEAALLRGMALFNNNKFEDARAAFRQARRDENTRQSANQWLAYLEEEEKRRALR